MKYFIRTTGERTLDESFSQIKYELLVDKEHNARKSFVEQLEYLATLDEDVVLLEDDLILCRNFKQRIEEVISKYKDKVINFFYNPTYWYKYYFTYSFNWNQCVYYSKEILPELAKAMREAYTKYPNTPHDELEGAVLSKLRIRTCIPRPCLVQHLDLNTLIQKFKCGNRRTPYFIDYLEELNIPYEEAYKPENKQKLIDLMNEKFENYSLIK